MTHHIWMLQTASDVSASYDALVDLFECIGNFLKRLRIYSDLSVSPSMADIIVKILVELLSVLALATKQTKQGRFSKCVIVFEVRDLNMPQRNLQRSCWERARSRPFYGDGTVSLRKVG